MIRRSNLIMPVNRPKFVAKSWTRGADIITLDLEDAVIESEKAAARGFVRDAITVAGQGGSVVAVRINNTDSAMEDLEASVFPGLGLIRIPKVEDAETLIRIEQRISELEKERGLEENSVGVTLSFETALGFVCMDKLISASKRTVAIGLGTEDFTKDLGIELQDPSILNYPKFYTVIMARAHNVMPTGLVGSLANFRDLDGMFALARKSYAFGFRGAGCIHPDQVAVLNRAFAPQPEEVEHARAVIEVYEEARRKGQGSASLNGSMIDLPVVKRAERVLKIQTEIEAYDAHKRACMEKALANAERSKDA